HGKAGTMLREGGRKGAHIGVVPAGTAEADFDGSALAADAEIGNDEARAGGRVCGERRKAGLRSAVDQCSSIEPARGEPFALESKGLPNKRGRPCAGRHHFETNVAKRGKLPHSLFVALHFGPARRREGRSIGEGRSVEGGRLL